MKSYPLAGALALALAAMSVARADEYDDLRARWLETLVGPPTFTVTTALDTQLAELEIAVASNGTSRDPVNGTGLWDTLDTSPGRTYLWSDLASPTTGSHITSSYSRLRTMAAAWSTHGSTLKNNATLLNDIVGGLDWLYANRYNETLTEPVAWWWDWEIGTPLALNDTTTMLYAQLSATQRGNYMNAVNQFSPTATMTGANLMWKAQVVALRGILVKDGAKITQAKNAISPLFNYVGSGDGFYAEGSFLQHDKHPYNGGYGNALIADVLNFMYLLNGSTWTVTAASSSNVYNWLYQSFEPLLYKGEIMDMVRGREISRYDRPSHDAGRATLSPFLRATQIATAGDAAYYRRAVKYWLTADTTPAFAYDGLSIYDTILAESIMGNTTIAPRTELNGYFGFPEMNRAVHLRPGWGAGLAMHSTRIYNYESINSENLKGWHTADGMLYLYTADLNQFSGHFWPTVQPHRLPGTTVEAGITATQSVAGGATFVGNVEGYYDMAGASAMDLWPAGRTLRGKKAWFFFDDEVVCLGAGITASGGATIETVAENRRLTATGTNAFLVNNASNVSTLQTAPGTPVSLAGVNSAHLTGNVTGANIGYYFPGGAALKAVRETRTGAWTDINQSATRVWNTATQTNHYLTLWFDHGVNPGSASYAYALLPNYSSAQVQTYAGAPEFTVLENTTSAQAVKETTSASIGAFFWNDASYTVGSGTDAITSNKKAGVFLTTTNADSFEVGVSDPTRANAGTITVNLGRGATSVAFNDPSVTITQLSPTVSFSVNVNGTRGRTHRVRFNTGSGGDGYEGECEALPTAFSGATAVDITDANLSGGSGNHLPATTATGNPYVEYTINLPASGTWNVQALQKMGSSFGRYQASVAGGSDFGAVQDEYSLLANYSTADLGDVSFAAAGSQALRFRVVGKNASSSNYSLVFDALQLRKVTKGECETLVVRGSGATASDFVDANMSGGNGNWLNSTAVGQYVEYDISLPAAGTWGIEVGFKKNTSYGIGQASIVQSSADLGAPFDLYSASAAYGKIDLGSYYFNSSGTKTLRFRVVGKNAASSNWFLAFDYLRLVKR